MDKEASIVYRDSLELWLIRDRFVATQRSYSFPFMRSSWRENRYYYCPVCGEVWGKRLDVGAEKPRHFYVSQDCKPCSGRVEDMRYPWEEMNSWVLGANVLAHLIMIYTDDQEIENENCKTGIL